MGGGGETVIEALRPSETYEEATPTVPTLVIGGVCVELADATTRYDEWPAPTVIVADGPYGLGLFPGDPNTPDRL